MNGISYKREEQFMHNTQKVEEPKYYMATSTLGPHSDFMHFKYRVI